jgi:hypothetical protein
MLDKPGLPDFYRYNMPKQEKYTKGPQNVPNGYKMFHLAVNRQKWPFKYKHIRLQDLPKFTQIGIFGLKI